MGEGLIKVIYASRINDPRLQIPMSQGVRLIIKVRIHVRAWEVKLFVQCKNCTRWFWIQRTRLVQSPACRGGDRSKRRRRHTVLQPIKLSDADAKFTLLQLLQESPGTSIHVLAGEIGKPRGITERYIADLDKAGLLYQNGHGLETLITKPLTRSLT